ncbi:hypothetical protein VNO77_24578 [Canavalia gladiata]|uniref:Uncharacterized protein n=1 Tax=Canavalia gladiata TaxID=3824 RepID=A0AAN9L9Y5_CANGL
MRVLSFLFRRCDIWGCSSNGRAPALHAGDRSNYNFFSAATGLDPTTTTLRPLNDLTFFLQSQSDSHSHITGGSNVDSC